jgi:hypothetical protein
MYPPGMRIITGRPLFFVRPGLKNAEVANCVMIQPVHCANCYCFLGST